MKRKPAAVLFELDLSKIPEAGAIKRDALLLTLVASTHKLRNPWVRVTAVVLSP